MAIVNLVNLVVLEVGEWRGFLTSEDRNFIKVIRDYKVEKIAFGCRTTKKATSNERNGIKSKNPGTVLLMQNVDGVPIS